MVNEAVAECKALNASTHSDSPHKLRPWLDATDGEVIPYETVYVLRDLPVGAEDMQWAQKRITELLETEDAQVGLHNRDI